VTVRGVLTVRGVPWISCRNISNKAPRTLLSWRDLFGSFLQARLLRLQLAPLGVDISSARMRRRMTSWLGSLVALSTCTEFVSLLWLS